MAIDLGERRIGLAISDPSGTLARPWLTLACRGGTRAMVDAIVPVVETLRTEEEGVGALVVGHPRRLDGSPGPMTRRAEAVAEALRQRTGLPVALQDERLTSHEAESRLAVRERDWRQRKARLDAASAAVILQDYLDERARTAVPHPHP